MPRIFLMGILLWGMISWSATPFKLFITVQRWFESTRSVLLGYLRTMPKDVGRQVISGLGLPPRGV